MRYRLEVIDINGKTSTIERVSYRVIIDTIKLVNENEGFYPHWRLYEVHKAIPAAPYYQTERLYCIDFK